MAGPEELLPAEPPASQPCILPTNLASLYASPAAESDSGWLIDLAMSIAWLVRRPVGRPEAVCYT